MHLIILVPNLRKRPRPRLLTLLPKAAARETALLKATLEAAPPDAVPARRRRERRQQRPKPFPPEGARDPRRPGLRARPDGRDERGRGARVREA